MIPTTGQYPPIDVVLNVRIFHSINQSSIIHLPTGQISKGSCQAKAFILGRESGRSTVFWGGVSGWYHIGRIIYIGISTIFLDINLTSRLRIYTRGRNRSEERRVGKEC